MKINRLHEWNLTTAGAKQLQIDLAGQVETTGSPHDVKFVAGADISKPDADGKALAAVVVLSYPDMKVAEVKTFSAVPSMPYVPGLLSFRESPLILEACEQLSITPDLFLVDGQGYAHPRRMGLACHLGLFLDIPTIGCAKSRLTGTHGDPDIAAGNAADLVDKGEVIGKVLRTKDKVRPLYISVGHMIGLDNAVEWVLKCCRGYRMPEPTRLAHLAAGGNIIV